MKHLEFLNSMERAAFQVLWDNFEWRQAIGDRKHPWLCNLVGASVLNNHGFNLNDISSVNMYRATLETIDLTAEETVSGRLTDGLFFWSKEDLEHDLKELKKLIKEF